MRLLIIQLRIAAYSEDLRWCMVYQRNALEYYVRRIAENLGVSPATVSRTLEVLDRTGTVSKQEYPEDHNCAKKLTRSDEFLIMQVVTGLGFTFVKSKQN